MFQATGGRNESNNADSRRELGWFAKEFIPSIAFWVLLLPWLAALLGRSLGS